jgi:KaiC/GvpD/RAD55 family RecA-like ATPase
LNRAKEHEKEFEWLQATEHYGKAVELVISEKDISKAAELQEKKGFCFYRSAFQARDNVEFKKTIKKAIRSYQKERRLLEQIEEENNQSRIKHAQALIFYTKSWLETNIKKRIKLLDDWWTLEKEVLSTYEKNNDDEAIGRTCLNLLEGSLHYRFWIYSESPRNKKELVREGYYLAEKAIQKFSKLNNEHELTRGYCFAIFYIGFGGYFLASKNEIKTLRVKALDYSDKALRISKKNEDSQLLSWIYLTACIAVSSCKYDYVSSLNYLSQSIKYANITKDHFLICYGKGLQSMMKLEVVRLLEDPDKQRETLETISKTSQEQINHSRIINHRHSICVGYGSYSKALTSLAQIEPDVKIKTEILEKTISLLLKGTEEVKDWRKFSGGFFGALSLNCYLLSETKQKNEEKRNLLQRAHKYIEKQISVQRKKFSSAYFWEAEAYYRLALIQNGLARIESDVSQRTILLEGAVRYLEKCLDLVEKERQIRGESTWAHGTVGIYYSRLGEILQQLHSFTKEKKRFEEAIESYKKAIKSFKNTDLPTHIAESYWHLAQLHDQVCDNEESSRDYELASQAYLKATEKIPQLRAFYKEHSLYMQAWSEIELAKHYHSISKYSEAKQHYEKAAQLHASTVTWNYLAPNYLAWSYMEEAEALSRKENTQQAKQIFQKAYEEFCNTKESFKQKLEEITSPDEKHMTKKLFKASDLTRKYCQARILLEDAKLLDGKGKYLESSKKYAKTAKNISTIVEKTDVEAERNELKYVAILCRAWEKVAVAEETNSSESYLQAAELFEEAKDYCYTSKASLWALGNSNFCRGLAAGTNYQTSLDLGEHAKAKSFIKSASTHYEKAGFKTASEYAKATLRLFDAYAFMNKAENELDQEKRAKQYQMAENLLQIAASSFMKAKKTEKTAQVKLILKNVREEKALAVSLSQVMQAPSIASSTLSFAAPTPTSEASVGLENFEHANVQANLVTTVKQVKVGESFCLSIEFVNAGREPALLMKVENFIPSDFVVVKKPEIYRIEESCLIMKGKQLAPLKFVEVKLILQPSKKGDYRLNPKVQYLDERGQNKSLQLKTLEIRAEKVFLEDRISTGTQELDSLLLGGIPNEYAVVLLSSPCDERELIENNFLKAGIKEGISFYVTTEANNPQHLLENPNFYLFLCNPKPKNKVPDLPNVYKLQGKTDLNNLGIALTKAYRSLSQNLVHPKRICIEILSEVLEDYGSKITRKWISDLITNYGAKGFTMLAVINPRMHASEDLYAVLDLFDGEISLIQSDDPLDCKKSILVKKLRNQDYLKNPICLR